MITTILAMTMSLSANQAAAPQTTPSTAPMPKQERGMSLNRFKKKQLTKLMQADKDTDGKVSLAEYTAAHPGAKPRAFRRMDADGDGFITATEADARAAARFGKMDADGNGSLAATERGGKKKAAASTMAATPAGE